MKISELSKKSGVSQRMLRYMEQQGLLNPKRTESDYRAYGADDLKRILEIRELQRLGLTLREIAQLMSEPECADRILQDVFLRERDAFLDKQKSLRDLRERFTGKKHPYFEWRVAHSIRDMDEILASLAKKGWKNLEFSYMRFSDWQEIEDAGFLMIGEIIWQSSFYLLGSRDSSAASELKNFMAAFSKAAHEQWPAFDGNPPREIEREDMGEFFAASDIVVYLHLEAPNGMELKLVLPYQALFALSKSKSEG